MSKQTAQRLPAPSLFVGPPSRNTSYIELEKAATNNSVKAVPSAAIPGPTSPTTSQPPHSPPLTRQSTEISDRNRKAAGPREGSVSDGVGVGENQPRRRPRRPTAVLDAHWAALQSTLSDIELSASGSAHVFGEGHARALEDLRAAQVELARAWGSSEGADDNGLELSMSKSLSVSSKTSATKKQEKEKEGGKEEEEQQQQQQSPSDLNDAARRRDASDAYFAVVKNGVQDVVRKLDAVSDAMRAVEMQSREIWAEGESTTSLESDGTA